MGSGMGKKLNEVFKILKRINPILSLDYEDVMAGKTVGKFITNIKTKGKIKWN